MEDGGGHIGDRVRLTADDPVGKQHAGHIAGSQGMATAPSSRVVLKNFSHHRTVHSLSRGAIAGSVADKHIGSVFAVRPEINFARVEYF